MSIEKEVKFSVPNLAALLEKIRSVAKLVGTTYVRDTIYGMPGQNKIRLRISDNGLQRDIEAVFKYKLESEKELKTEVEETVYEGHDLVSAHQAIAEHGEFKPENSYEKVRWSYENDDAKITIDIYPYGTWVEIEGESEGIWKTAEKLGYARNEAIKKNADELYLDWIKQHHLPELWDVRFGLGNFDEK